MTFGVLWLFVAIYNKSNYYSGTFSKNDKAGEAANAGGVVPGAVTKSPEVSQAFTDSINAFKDSVQNKKLEEARLAREQLVIERNLLVKKFSIVEDDFTGVSRYHHRHWGQYWPKRTTITAHVNSNGFIHLRSNYFDDDWIFHYKVAFLINGMTYITDSVWRYDNSVANKVVSGGVHEIIVYENSEDIARLISRAEDYEVKVRFQGRQYHKDIILNKADKRAIADCYRMAQLIRKM